MTNTEIITRAKTLFKIWEMLMQTLLWYCIRDVKSLREIFINQLFEFAMMLSLVTWKSGDCKWTGEGTVGKKLPTFPEQTIIWPCQQSWDSSELMDCESPSAARYQKAGVLGLCRDRSISVENSGSAPEPGAAQRGFVNRQDQTQPGLWPPQPAGWVAGCIIAFQWPELRRLPPLLLFLLLCQAATQSLGN